MTASLPRQFVARALAIALGLTLLLLVNLHGALFYAAWALIATAFLSEVAATVVFWRRARNVGETGDD